MGTLRRHNFNKGISYMSIEIGDVRREHLQMSRILGGELVRLH